MLELMLVLRMASLLVSLLAWVCLSTWVSVLELVSQSELVRSLGSPSGYMMSWESLMPRVSVSMSV